jgi:hypothetical protein
MKVDQTMKQTSNNGFRNLNERFRYQEDRRANTCRADRMKNPMGLCLTVLLALSLVGCIHFRAESPGLSGDPVPCQLRALRVETVNFRLNALKGAEKAIFNTLTESGCRIQAKQGDHVYLDSTEGSHPTSTQFSADEEIKLRVVFEAFPRGKHDSDYIESKPGHFSVRRLSLLTLRQTFGFLPVYQLVERRLTFELWRDNQLIESFFYTSSFHEVFGLAGILLYPFEDGNDLEQDARGITLRFIHDAHENPQLIRNTEDLTYEM